MESQPDGGRREDAMRKLTLGILASLLMAMSLPTSSAVTNANFHTRCEFVRSSGDDPIVHPGVHDGLHMHDFYGNTTTNADSTFESMRAGSTSCLFGPDTSGYWTPTLIDPKGNEVTPMRLGAYYWNRGTTVSVPPSDLRIVAGGDTSDLRVAGYTCGKGTPSSSVPLDCGSKWLKGVVIFPSCWDGVHTDSADHRSHMAYPTGKGCPSSHPVELPKLVLHFTYGITDGRGYSLTSDMFFDTMDGRSLHADFWNVWQPDALAEAVDALNAGVTQNLRD
jgi:hypothetical protein